MCTLATYNKLEQHRPPEIDRVPIYETVIELLDVGLVPEQVLIGVDPKRVVDAVSMLTKLGMTTVVDGKRKVTDSGHFAPHFPLSARNAAFLWKWVTFSGLHLPTRVIEEFQVEGLDLTEFEVDTEDYSWLRPAQFQSLAGILQYLNLQPTTIIDATAGVGALTIQLAHLFPDTSIIAVEPTPNTALILRRNAELIPTITSTNVSTDRSADIIFTTDTNQVGDLLQRGLAPLVAIKLPADADVNTVVATISVPIVPQLFNVTDSNGAVSYLLLVVSLETPVPLVEGVGELAEIPLVGVSRPVFPGIVMAAIIDSY